MGAVLVKGEAHSVVAPKVAGLGKVRVAEADKEAKVEMVKTAVKAVRFTMDRLLM